MSENMRDGLESTENVEAEIVPNPDDIINKATQAAERLEAANKKMEEMIRRQEALSVQNTLSGKAVVNVPKKEETPEEYAARVSRGEF